ncbi:MAG: hypothetical protein JWQ62_167, partial [Lacunisphaera sp.]|nr:hypothetical protein [Lacunisphaera sp.]
MKTKLSRCLIYCVAAMLALSPAAFAQRQLGKKKGP